MLFNYYELHMTNSLIFSLQGLFKNTSETPIVIEDEVQEGPELKQKGLQINETAAEKRVQINELQQRRGCRSVKLKQRRRLP